MALFQMKDNSKFLLIALAFLGFISIGLPDGLLGVAWPSIRLFFHLPLDALGNLLLTLAAGYLLSSFCSGWILARVNVGTLLALSCLATGVSLLGYALARHWYQMVVLGLLSGIGAGAIDAGLNTFAARHFSARTVNWLHACYGIGATFGPLIMTRTLIAGRPWQWAYGLVATGQLALALVFGRTKKRWPDQAAPTTAAMTETTRAPQVAVTLRLPVAWLSIAVFFVYTGIEAAAGTWTYSLFTEARGTSASQAGWIISSYWAIFTAGRICAGVIIRFAPVALFLRSCILGMAVGAFLLWLHLSDWSSWFGLALIGLAAAPVFPTLIAVTPQRLGHAHLANGVGFQIAAAVLGQSILPGFIGVLAQYFGLEIVAPVLLAAILLLFALHEGLMAKGGAAAAIALG